MIDHSLLGPQLARQDIEVGCAIAAHYRCFSVTVKPHYIELARKLLKDTGIKVGSVVGFPHGGMTTATKMFETQDALQRGADEIDMVINIGALRDKENLLVQNDIAAVVKTARGHIVKVILENCFLTEEEKARGCKIAEAAGAAFVQTSTGYGSGEAIAADVRLMRASVSSRVQVKAAGGMDSWQVALEMIEAGATRLATGQTEKIAGG
jgi:deoxyribose-phosphate aldolase